MQRFSKIFIALASFMLLSACLFESSSEATTAYGNWNVETIVIDDSSRSFHKFFLKFMKKRP